MQQVAVDKMIVAVCTFIVLFQLFCDKLICKSQCNQRNQRFDGNTLGKKFACVERNVWKLTLNSKKKCFTSRKLSLEDYAMRQALSYANGHLASLVTGSYILSCNQQAINTCVTVQCDCYYESQV